jgi:uncharacterized protein YoxC
MSEEMMRQLVNAETITVLAIALVAFCVVFGPALFKLISTLSEYVQKLVEINNRLAQQAEDTRRTLEHANTIDEQQTSAIRSAAESASAGRQAVEVLDTRLDAGFSATEQTVNEAAERILEKLEPVLARLDEVGEDIAAVRKATDLYQSQMLRLDARLDQWTATLDAARSQLLQAVRTLPQTLPGRE